VNPVRLARRGFFPPVLRRNGGEDLRLCPCARYGTKRNRSKRVMYSVEKQQSLRRYFIQLAHTIVEILDLGNSRSPRLGFLHVRTYYELGSRFDDRPAFERKKQNPTHLHRGVRGVRRTTRIIIIIVIMN